MNKEWLEKCFDVAEMLYCVFPYDVLKQLYARGGYGELDEAAAVEYGKTRRMEYVDATLSEFEDMEPGFFRPELIDEDDEKYEEVKKQADAGDQYNRMHLYENEIDELLMEQGDRPFYIPLKSEIKNISEKKYVDNEWYRKLKKLIPVDKEFVAETIWIGISTGSDPMSGFEEFYPFFFKQGEYPTMDEFQKVMNALMECYAHTNLRSNRGWEPLKLYNRMEKSNGPTTIIPMSSNMADSLREAEDEVKDMGFNVDYDAGFGTFNKVENDKVKKIKVGRNEPCPCGSGKKYKRCHGRNEKVIPQNQMWNTAVVFGPLEGCNIPVEDYYFQGGTEEGIIYIGRKKTSEPVKLNFTLGDDEPTKIFVVSDKLYDIVSAMPTMLEQDGFFINVGLYDEDEDILEVNLLRDMRNVR